MGPPFKHFNQSRVKRVWEGIRARSVNGERMTMALVDLDADAELPPHQHENEQMGFVIDGELEMTVGGETSTLHAGDTYTIPGNVLHSAVTGSRGAVVVDVFAPIRADWGDLPEEDPSPSNWGRPG